MVKTLIKSFLPKLMGLRLMTLYKIKPEKAIRKAFLLFCTPRKGFIKPHQKDFLKAHQADKIGFKKIKIQTYRWPGQGQKVLLVHGWDSHSFRWKALINKLQAKDFDITAFDAPAHGYSEGNILNVPIYHEVLQLMIKEYSPDILIGHSIGAMTCIYNQYEAKNRAIKKIVLLGSPSEMQRFMSGFQKILGLSHNFMQAIENYFENRYNYSFEAFSVAKFATTIDTNSLIIHDKFDKIVPYKEAIEINKSLKNSTLMLTEGAGHSLNNENINTAILKFILI
ncbi:alpha/beta hydrolase [Psychroflexus sp. MBR-150]